jgi:hypothetical protein
MVYIFYTTFLPQSTYVYTVYTTVPQYMSPRRNWDSPTPTPLPQASVPPVTKWGGGGALSPAGVGVGGGVPLNSDDWGEKA